MHKKSLIEATFSDGKRITRRTHRTYTHAWRVGESTGFSESEGNATKQAVRYAMYAPTHLGLRPVVEIVQAFEVFSAQKVAE